MPGGCEATGVLQLWLTVQVNKAQTSVFLKRVSSDLHLLYAASLSSVRLTSESCIFSIPLKGAC